MIKQKQIFRRHMIYELQNLINMEIYIYYNVFFSFRTCDIWAKLTNKANPVHATVLQYKVPEQYEINKYCSTYIFIWFWWNPWQHERKLQFLGSCVNRLLNVLNHLVTRKVLPYCNYCNLQMFRPQEPKCKQKKQGK